MISIVIATLNADAVLERCLLSIFAQKDAAYEVLLADGVSTDTTWSIVERYRPRFAYAEQRRDSGVYDAWNSLLPHVKGDWVMFLGADDWLADAHSLQRLQAKAATLSAARPALDYIYGLTDLMQGDHLIDRLGVEQRPGHKLAPSGAIPFSHTGLLHHRDLFDRFGGFDTRYRIAADYAFIARSTTEPATRFIGTGQPVACMSAGGMSTSARSRVRCFEEVAHARRSLGLTPKRPAWLVSSLLRANAVYHVGRVFGPSVLLKAANLFRRVRGRPLRADYL